MSSAPLPGDEAERLRSLVGLGVLDSAPEPEFEALVQAAALVCGAPISLISLIDTDRQWFKANVGLPGVTQTPRDLAFCAHAILQDGVFEVPDATRDPRFADTALVTGDPKIRFYAGATLRLSDGTHAGTLCVIDRQPRALDGKQRALLGLLATAAVRALEGRRALRAERALRETLREREDLFRQAFHQSPVGTVIVRTRDDLCTDCNDTFAALAGRARDELVGHRTGDWALVMPQGGDAAVRSEFAWTTRSGQRRHALVSSQAVVLHGEPHRLTCTVDITERKQMEESLREAMRSAEQANQAKSQFLANMSHEIRTPLHAVIGLTQVLAQSALDADQASLLDHIEVASQSLLGVVSDVLDLSKIEAGELTLECAPFAIGRLIEDLCKVMRRQARARRIAFRLDLDADLPEVVVGDAVRLRQVLSNLLFNAIKFTEQGEVRLEVRLLARQAGAVGLRFAVHDSGIGIAADVQAQLFKPFTQADASTTRRYGGTGLGLSIVKRLTDLAGGSLGMSSTLGQGSEFWVRMDFRRSQVEAVPVAVAAEPWMAGRGLDGVRVLVVDDSDINLAVARRMLMREGARVVLADHGQEAVDRLRAGPEAFDVVLMDVQMPVLDGNAATRCIREELGLRRLPVIAVSAGALTSQREHSVAAGMTDFVSKPFDAATLVAAIRRHLPAAPAPARAARPPAGAVSLLSPAPADRTARARSPR